MVVFVFSGHDFKVFSLGRVVLYTVFMVCPVPKTLAKNLAKSCQKIWSTVEQVKQLRKSTRTYDITFLDGFP